MSIIRRETAEEDGYSFMIQLRGDLEKIMIALKKDRGANPDQQISMFIDKNQIDVMMELKETPFQ